MGSGWLHQMSLVVAMEGVELASGNGLRTSRAPALDERTGQFGPLVARPPPRFTGCGTSGPCSDARSHRLEGFMEAPVSSAAVAALVGTAPGTLPW